MQDRLTFALRAHHVASALRCYPEGCLRQAVSLRSAPRTSSLSIALSKALSATIRLSCPLSFSSSLSRLTVSSRAPPYCSFQRWEVGGLNSSFLQTSSTLWPPASCVAASRSFLLISSGVCRLRFMVRVRRRWRAANSHSARINFRGAGHIFTALNDTRWVFPLLRIRRRPACLHRPPDFRGAPLLPGCDHERLTYHAQGRDFHLMDVLAKWPGRSAREDAGSNAGNV